MEQQEMEKEMRILNEIENNALKAFVSDFLIEYSNDTKIKEANKTGDVIIKLLKYKNFWDAPVRPAFIDALLAASLLYNIFYDENDLTTLFKLRKVIKDMDLRKEGIEFLANLDIVIQITEGQLGEQTPIPLCKPNEVSPGGLFAQAVWISKNFNLKL